MFAYLYKYGNRTLLEIVLEWCDGTLDYLSQLDVKEWLILFAAMIVVGAICMRGFGSRHQY